MLDSSETETAWVAPVGLSNRWFIKETIVALSVHQKGHTGVELSLIEAAYKLKFGSLATSTVLLDLMIKEEQVFAAIVGWVEDPTCLRMTPVQFFDSVTELPEGVDPEIFLILD
jgi:hypothetical protein